MKQSSGPLAALSSVLLIAFSAANPASAQAKGEIRDVIYGQTVDIKCSTFFPGLPNDTDPAAEKIALIDSAVYHRGQTGPVEYALMSKTEREEHWDKPFVNPFNRPLYDHTAKRYDNAKIAGEEVAVLQELLAESHADFPTSRWDDWAKQCTSALS